jgi:hypothetical protein
LVKLLRNFFYLPSPTTAYITILKPSFRQLLGMVFAYAAVSATQKPCHPAAAKAVRQDRHVYLVSSVGTQNR